MGQHGGGVATFHAVPQPRAMSMPASPESAPTNRILCAQCDSRGVGRRIRVCEGVALAGVVGQGVDRQVVLGGLLLEARTRGLRLEPVLASVSWGSTSRRVRRAWSACRSVYREGRTLRYQPPSDLRRYRADARTRTGNHLFTRQVRCQLRHAGDGSAEGYCHRRRAPGRCVTDGPPPHRAPPSQPPAPRADARRGRSHAR